MYLEQIQSITTWDYCKIEQIEDDEALYQFGFKDGVHFYLSEYFFEDSLGRFCLNCFLNKKQEFADTIHSFEEVISEINKILDDNRTETI